MQGLRCWLKAMWLALALAALAPASAGTPPANLRIPPGESSVSLSPVILYWHDEAAGANPAAAYARANAGDFQPLPGGSPAFGFRPGAFWFYLPLVNQHPDEPRWTLVQEYALSDYIDIYLRYPDGRIVHKASGDHLPFANRFIRYRHPNVRLELPLDERVELLVRVQSQSSMQVPLTLYTPQALSEVMRDSQFSTGLYYGIVLALLFYNLVLWLMLRDASYFWYLLHNAAFGLVLFTLNGYGFEYLWPNSAWLADASVPISICLALVGMQLFARSFLELPQRWKAGNAVSLGVAGFFAALAVASIWLPYRIATPLASRAVLVGVLWIIAAAIVMLRRGYRPARIFLLAWSLFLAGTAAFTLLAFGVLPQNFWTQNGVQIGSALEMLLLSLALGSRYAGLRNENIRVVQRANEELERSVTARTEQLRRTMAQLGEANVQLREYSRRDPLTGAYNRRHFRESLQAMLQGRRDGAPLALLMLDLDHFKAINDSHGHLAGDDCLTAAARWIAEVAEPHGGLVARFGGEEFVVLLPGLSAAAAMQVAEAIRLRIRQAPVPCGDEAIPLSVSIGVHGIGAGSEAGPDDVIRHADAALYRAKSEGRDRVRRSPMEF